MNSELSKLFDKLELKKNPISEQEQLYVEKYKEQQKQRESNHWTPPAEHSLVAVSTENPEIQTIWRFRARSPTVRANRERFWLFESECCGEIVQFPTRIADGHKPAKLCVCKKQEEKLEIKKKEAYELADNNNPFVQAYETFLKGTQK